MNYISRVEDILIDINVDVDFFVAVVVDDDDDKEEWEEEESEIQMKECTMCGEDEHTQRKWVKLVYSLDEAKIN